nr:hypothetical protein [Tanacetum cinerariifolium]
MQAQTSNTLHNAIMEAGGKDRPPMLALDKEVLISEGSSVTTTKTYTESYKNVSQDIRDQLNAKAEAVQIILTGIDNDIYSTVDAFPNACEMWKVIERLKHDDEISKDKETDKLIALISLSFKKIYKPTNKNLRTSSNTSRANLDNSPRINRGAGYDNQRECQKPNRVKDAAYHREKMLLCKQEEAGIQLNAEQADWWDDTDDESKDQELEAHYMYMAQIQEVSPDAADVGVKDEHIVIIDSLDMSYNREHIDQNDGDDDLANERELLASLIEKLKCEIDDSKNRNKFLETSNKVLVKKLKGEIKDFKKKSLESSNNHYKEANNKLLETNKLLYNDFKKSQAELERRNEVEYASKLYKTREDKELDKVIALENKVKVLDNIVYKTGQSVQTMNMLNSKYRMSSAKPEFLKKAQRANPRLYDIEEMVADLRYFNSLELEVDSLKSQLETQQTQFLNEIDRLLREYYYADHMNAILGNVKPNVSRLLGNASRATNVLEPMTSRSSTVSNTPLSSNSFAARRD